MLSFAPPRITFEHEDQPAAPATSLPEDSHVSDRSDMMPEAERESEPEIEPEDIAGGSIFSGWRPFRGVPVCSFYWQPWSALACPQWMDEHREKPWLPIFRPSFLRAIARRLDTDSNDPALSALGEDGLDAAGHEHALHLWISHLPRLLPARGQASGCTRSSVATDASPPRPRISMFFFPRQ